MSLSAADLAGMSETLTASLPDLCSIDHVTKVADGAGGRTDSISTTNNVPCRFVESSQKRGSELVYVDVLVAVSGWLFTFPVVAGTDDSIDWPGALAAIAAIDVPDRIHVNGRTFEVETVFHRTWEIDLRVFCREVR